MGGRQKTSCIVSKSLLSFVASQLDLTNNNVAGTSNDRAQMTKGRNQWRKYGANYSDNTGTWDDQGRDDTGSSNGQSQQHSEDNNDLQRRDKCTKNIYLKKK